MSWGRNPFGDSPSVFSAEDSRLAARFDRLVRRLQADGMDPTTAKREAVALFPDGHRATVLRANRPRTQARAELDGPQLLAALPSHVRITGGAARVLR